MKTTLNQIRAHSPCAGGWKKLLAHLNKTQADDEPLSLSVILASNGVDDTLWALRAVDGYDREKRLFAVWCARQVQHLVTDPRSLAALDVAERYASGDADEAELTAARDAAWAAASGAAWAARDAAWAASDAAWAASDAAWAASDAARAARAAASDARAAARATQSEKLAALLVLTETDQPIPPGFWSTK